MLLLTLKRQDCVQQFFWKIVFNMVWTWIQIWIRNRNRNPNQNFCKVGNGNGSGINSSGSTTMYSSRDTIPLRISSLSDAQGQLFHMLCWASHTYIDSVKNFEILKRRVSLMAVVSIVSPQGITLLILYCIVYIYTSRKIRYSGLVRFNEDNKTTKKPNTICGLKRELFIRVFKYF